MSYINFVFFYSFLILCAIFIRLGLEAFNSPLYLLGPYYNSGFFSLHCDEINVFYAICTKITSIKFTVF